MIERATGLTIKPRSLENIYNYISVSDRLKTSGQPDAKELALIADAGFTSVINLAPKSVLENSLQTESQVLADLNVDYVHIPVDFQAPTQSDFERFVDAMHQRDSEKVWVHCAANMRVSAFMYCYQTSIQNEAPDIAAQRLAKIWQPSKVWRRFIKENGPAE